MEKTLQGYIIYNKDGNKEIPFGIVSDSFDCKAETSYISNRMRNYLVEIEDRRFYQHNGVDLKGITRAFYENFKARRVIQGGSSITQQLARSLMQNNKRTISRKIEESRKALQIEKLYSKTEILNLYLNNVYFGKNIWGLRSACIYYFGKEVENISQPEFIYLLTILRGPNYYRQNPGLAIKRYKLINDILYKRGRVSISQYRRNIRKTFNLQENGLVNIKQVSIPYISEIIDENKKKITSTIDANIQRMTNQFVSESKYPVSIIVIEKGKVLGFSSSYGTDYPFVAKSNVGSTLKPFLYCYLRNNGISNFDSFESDHNNLSWNVREVKYHNKNLTIKDALMCSNNNTFINASHRVGIGSVLNYLANILSRDVDDFYPSSILGATKSGISLYELALAYSNYFNQDMFQDEIKKECISILNDLFYERLGVKIENAFLKTGTTNNNQERYLILGNSERVYAFLRNGNEVDDTSKEGGFINHVARYLKDMFKSKTEYRWT